MSTATSSSSSTHSRKEGESTTTKNVRFSPGEVYNFQSDINQLLSIIINTFYSNKDVFLRELISNCSDALDKIRHVSLTDKNALGSMTNLEIQVIPNREAKTLTIKDTGIGMTKADLINNLGVIAKSGTKEFIEKLSQGGSTESTMSLIGQFGCGAYSAFLVADKVAYHSKNNDDEQYVWESDAGGTFTVRKDDDENNIGRGTMLVLHMKDDQLEYLEEGRLREIIKKHSDFISYPVKLMVEKQVTEKVEKEEEETNEEIVEEVSSTTEEAQVEEITKKVSELEVVNSQKPVWTKKPEEVTEEEYKSFYKTLGNDWEEHQAVKHFSVEGQLEFRGILYVPQTPPFDFMGSANNGERQKNRNIKLYVNRVFIMDDCEDLYPEYLSFVKGVVDSNDLPLNISREMLQQNKILRVIKKNLVKKTLEMLNDLSEKGEEEYGKFWKNFGKNIKWGICEDSANKDKLMGLLRFYTSKTTGEDMTHLKEYITRMPETQKDIYYITGDNRLAVENSPFLEKLKQKGYEVIYLTDPIDEYMIQNMTEYEGKKFRNVTKEGLELADSDEDKEALEKKRKDHEEMCKAIKDILEDRVVRVEVSQRITETPCVLVTDQYGLSANMERILKSQPLRKNDIMGPVRTNKVLEINVEHPIMKHIKAGIEKKDDEREQKYVKDLVNLVFEVSMVHSGFTLENPAVFSKKIFSVIGMNVAVEEEVAAEEDVNVVVEENNEDITNMESVD